MPNEQKNEITLDKIVNLAKRRGFVFQGSDIYGGLANTWDYGPLGSELKFNIRKAWWRRYVQQRSDIIGLDASVLMNSKVWEASGHVESFNDPLVEDKATHKRYRADHLLEEHGIKAEGMSLEQMQAIIEEKGIKSPEGNPLTAPKQFNMMFRTYIGPVEDSANRVYLRPETAQGIFVNFKNVMDTARQKIPFGIAQTGKAFRNEITPGNFIFRTIEFEQMEIEYFVKPGEDEKIFDEWQQEMMAFLVDLGLKRENLRFREHGKEELSHYSKRTIDIEYKFPFGFKELTGLANRTDFDLKQHAKHSGEDLSYRDPVSKESFVPYVIEPTWGLDRLALAVMCDAYTEVEGGRTTTTEATKEKEIIMKINYNLASYTVGVLPLSKKEELTGLAEEISENLRNHFSTDYDESGSIGRRYRRQDEIGTPFCVTVDFDTLDDRAVTIRDRDTMEQERVGIDELIEVLNSKINANPQNNANSAK